MRVLLYSEGMKFISKSGVGRAIKHQMKALDLVGVDYTTDFKDKDYDLVHINTVGPYSIYLAGKAHKHGKKVILHAHSTEEDFKDSFFFSNWIAPLFKKWLVFAYTRADELITPTPYSKRLLSTYNMGLPIHAVSNGIDLSRFKKDELKAISFREKYGFASTDKIILSVGLHIKRKGIFDFVEIARKCPDYQFVWCGYTSPSLLSKDIKTLLKTPPKNVHFLGYVDDMRGPYSGADLFFMPTYEETEGIVVLEALAARQPVVIRDIPVYEGWLIDKENCYKGSTNQEFEAIIKDVINQQIDSLADSGYKVVEERTLDKVGIKLSLIYKGLVREV